VACDAVVLNRMLPREAGEEAWFRDWARLQEERRREIEELFSPHPVLVAPLREDEVTGVRALARHGAELFADLAPDAVLSDAPRLRFRRDGHCYVAELPLPGADPALLDVAKIEDELTVTAGVRRRVVRLPRRFAPLDLRAARLEGGMLEVRFERATGAG
jgi:arsenite-transporting ATPase